MSGLPGATVVTGAGGVGCGRAIACLAARSGAPVIAADINDAGGEETVRLIQAHGGDAVFHHADVRDAGHIRELMTVAEARYGRVAVLVNNASSPEPAREGMDGWTETIQTDLMGTLLATQFAVDAMRRSGGGGSVVSVSSISALWHGRRTAGGFPGYDVAKAGVIRMTTGLAGLASQNGIRVNCLAPGWIATGGALAYWQSLTPTERAARGVPAQLLQPTDVAHMVWRMAADTSLAGRVVLWWSEEEPRLIEWSDRGYREGGAY